MKRKAPLHLKQWPIVRRLQAVGCPLDYEHLRQPCYLYGYCRTQLEHTYSRSPGGTRLAIHLRLQTFAPLIIQGFSLSISGVTDEISLVQACDEHPGHYCPPLPSHQPHVKLPSNDVLNDKVLDSRWFPRSGYLLAQIPNFVFPVSAKLEATVNIVDLFGEEYPFPIVLENKLSFTFPESADDLASQLAEPGAQSDPGAA